MFEADLLKMLRDDAPLGEILASFENRTLVDWVRHPRPAAALYPKLRMIKISPGEVLDQKGTDALSSPRVQFDFFSDDPLTNRQAFNRVLAIMTGLKAEPKTVGATKFQAAYRETDRDIQADEDANGVDIYHLTGDFIIWNTATT